jgi:hypothetical protein
MEMQLLKQKFNKTHWLQDGNGEIDPEEMEDIFTKLCKETHATQMPYAWEKFHHNGDISKFR